MVGQLMMRTFDVSDITVKVKGQDRSELTCIDLVQIEGALLNYSGPVGTQKN